MTEARDASESASIASIAIDFMSAHKDCAGTSDCKRMVARNLERLQGRYIGLGKPADGQVIAAILRLRGLVFQDYLRQTKKRSKGVDGQIKRAAKSGYYCKPFPRSQFLPDIVEINRSKPVRSGGQMRQTYLKGVEEMGGYPTKPVSLEMPRCHVHFDLWWGVFKTEEGYKQGDVETGERLCGYINLRRLGNYGLYSLILGHGEHLSEGIMYALHLAIIEWLADPANPFGRGFDFLVYAGYKQGTEGLQQWKRKFGFEPAYLYLPENAPRPRPTVFMALRGRLRTLRQALVSR
jgi:hypothetical protein